MDISRWRVWAGVIVVFNVLILGRFPLWRTMRSEAGGGVFAWFWRGLLPLMSKRVREETLFTCGWIGLYRGFVGAYFSLVWGRFGWAWGVLHARWRLHWFFNLILPTYFVGLGKSLNELFVHWLSVGYACLSAGFLGYLGYGWRLFIAFGLVCWFGTGCELNAGVVVFNLHYRGVCHHDGDSVACMALVVRLNACNSLILVLYRVFVCSLYYVLYGGDFVRSFYRGHGV